MHPKSGYGPPSRGARKTRGKRRLRVLSGAVPDEVKRFLAEHVRSVMALELLLVLRADPARTWTAEQLCRELRCGHDWMNRELARLAERGLVTKAEDSGEFRYARNPVEADGPMAWLAASYPDRRYSIIQAIYAGPADPIKSFADAFRLRKENKDG